MINQAYPYSTNLASTKIQWKQLLNSSQLITKDTCNFPEVKTCRLRMTYSKLQHHSNLHHPHPIETARGSFLLGKGLANYSPQLGSKNKKQKVFNQRYSKNKGQKQISFSHTIDVAKIKSLAKSHIQNNHQDSRYNSQVGKYQNFNEYLKKIVISQKANYDISKFYSQGKGMEMTDRTNFQKLQRLKFSILNRKMEEKQKIFHCVSTKMNFNNQLKLNPEQLPSLPKKSIDQGKRIEGRKREQRGEKKKVNEFMFEPWQNDNINNDFDQQ